MTAQNQLIATIPAQDGSTDTSVSCVYKILVCSDLHLKEQEPLGYIDGVDGLNFRTRDKLRLLSSFIQTGITLQVDEFLLAGDTYDAPNPSERLREAFQSACLPAYQPYADSRMAQHQETAFHILVGNHEYIDTSCYNFMSNLSPYLTPIFRTLSRTIRKGTQDITFFYFGAVAVEQYLQRKEWSDLFQNTYDVIFGHTTLSGARVGPSNYTLTPEECPALHARLIVLGDTHKAQTVPPNIYYCGSLDRIDFGERHEPKGVSLLSFYENGTITVQFLSLPVRRLKQLDFLQGAPLPDKDIQHEDIVKCTFEGSPEWLSQLQPSTILKKIRDTYNPKLLLPPKITRWKSELQESAVQETNASTVPEDLLFERFFQMETTTFPVSELVEESVKILNLANSPEGKKNLFRDTLHSLIEDEDD